MCGSFESPPVPSPFPWAPAPMCFLLAFAMMCLTSFVSELICRLLRFVPGLSSVIMFVVVAFLVHSLMAHGELALPRPWIEWGVTCILPESLWFRLSLVGNVRLFLKDSQLLLMRLWSLHKPTPSCCAAHVYGANLSPPPTTTPAGRGVRC